MRHHTRDERVLRPSELLDGNRLPLQVPDGTYSLGAKQLEAAGLNSSQHDNGLARIELQDGRTDILHGDVDGASSHGVARFGCPLPCDVLDIAEPLAAQQLLSHILRRSADAGDARESYPGGFGRRLGSGGMRPHGKKPQAAQSHSAAEKCASRDHALSSRLSSFQKRQSVPSAMILFGLDLIMPASRSRSA